MSGPHRRGARGEAGFGDVARQAQVAALGDAAVGNDDDLRQVCLGEAGAFAGMEKGAIFVDHTTVSAMVTRELAAIAADMGLGFVDAPVSGGQAGAENGQLSVMCGGDPAQYARAEPVIAAYPDSPVSYALRMLAADLMSWPVADSQGPGGLGQFTQQLLHLSQQITPTAVLAG